MIRGLLFFWCLELLVPERRHLLLFDLILSSVLTLWESLIPRVFLVSFLPSFDFFFREPRKFDGDTVRLAQSGVPLKRYGGRSLRRATNKPKLYQVLKHVH